MMKLIRLLSLLCALSLIAAACGGDDEDASAGGDTTTTTAPTTTTTEATTTTEVSTSTTQVPSGPTMPLTGEPLGDDGVPDHPAVVVKVSNNDSTARRALMGLDQADVIFEERIEVQATRFAAVFHSSLPTEVGSVRSGRTSDVQIVSNLNRPVFAYSGANDGVSSQLREAESSDLLIRASNDMADPQFRRISEFSAPDNLVVDAAALLDKADGGEPPQAIFEYSDNSVGLGAPSPGVRVAAREDAIFAWSPADRGYLRFQGGERASTRDGEDLVIENIVVLTTTYVPSTIDAQSVDAITVGSGPVEIHANGHVVFGTWEREFPRDPYTFTTSDGEVIGLAPGQTWVSLTPAGTSSEIGRAEADELIAG